MKHTVTMLSTQPGCDEGVIYPTTYQQGEQYEIGDELLRCFVSLGAVEPAGAKPAATRGAIAHLESIAATVVGVDGPIPAGDIQEAVKNPAELRETKVAGPEETKPAKPLAKMSKAELVTHAMTAHNLELVPDSMTAKEMIAAIETAASA